MIVEINNPDTIALDGAEFDRVVPEDADPDDPDSPDVEARRARVSADLGESLVEKFDAVTIHEDERESAPVTEASDAADDTDEDED